MTHENTLPTQPAPLGSLAKHLLIGAAIGLAAISFFVFVGGQNPPAEWGRNWRIRPLLLTPVITAIGGLCFYFWTGLFKVQGWKRTVVIVLGVIGFIISVWMGLVLGLKGIMWN